MACCNVAYNAVLNVTTIPQLYLQVGYTALKVVCFHLLRSI